MIKENLEQDILSYGLLIGASYQLYQLLMSLVPHMNIDLALVNVLITMVLFFYYLIAQRKGAHPLLLHAVHFSSLAGLTFFWKNFGGMAGTVPSFLCVYTSFIVVSSHGITRGLIVSILVAMLGVYFLFPQWLGMQSSFEPEHIDVNQRNIDYVIVGALILAFTLYMKNKFMFYRDRVSTRYRQLDQIANTLHQQNQELVTRQEETRAINDNLETLVEKGAREVEDKNLALAEYAFINAHMLRGPLCRMMGLIHLMEREPDRYNSEQLTQLKTITHEIDQRIREINSVIS
jgi:signal transduction histidine kinase